MHPNGLYAFVANSNASKVEVIDMKKFHDCSTIETGKVLMQWHLSNLIELFQHLTLIILKIYS
jgi:hypothetical protein